MTGREQHAQSGRGSGSFPAEWGTPQGSQFSEARAAWVRRNVEARIGLAPYRQLAAADARLLSLLRQAQIQAREKGPDE